MGLPLIVQTLHTLSPNFGVPVLLASGAIAQSLNISMIGQLYAIFRLYSLSLL